MRRALNTERIEGYVYQHKLERKTVSNQASANYGKPFIAGTVEVAVDEEGLNVIPVHFTYVTEVTSGGKENATYKALEKIIDGKNWITDGKDEAIKVSISTAIALNDFYNQNDELISTKVNEGGFVSIVSELKKEEERNTFQADMLITNVSRVEKDEEKNIESDYVVVKGAIFNFRNSLLPVDFVIRKEDGMNYFESLGVSPAEPVYTKVWGKIVCNTIKREVTEESAFGEATVRVFERKTKEWEITGTAKAPHDFGDENILTADEVKKAIQDREIELAEIKKRSEEYRAQRNAGTATAAVTAAPAPSTTTTGTFNF